MWVREGAVGRECARERELEQQRVRAPVRVHVTLAVWVRVRAGETEERVHLIVHRVAPGLVADICAMLAAGPVSMAAGVVAMSPVPRYRCLVPGWNPAQAAF